MAIFNLMKLSVPLTGTKVRKRPFQWPENGRFGGRNGRFGGRNDRFGGRRNDRFGLRNGRFGFRKGTKKNGYEKECKSHAKNGRIICRMSSKQLLLTTVVRPRQAESRPGKAVRPDVCPDVRPHVRADVPRRTSGRASGRTPGMASAWRGRTPALPTPGLRIPEIDLSRI